MKSNHYIDKHILEKEKSTTIDKRKKDITIDKEHVYIKIMNVNEKKYNTSKKRRPEVAQEL